MQPDQGQGAELPDGKAAGQRAGQVMAASPRAGRGAHQPAEQKTFQLTGAVVGWWAWVIFAIICLADIAFTGRSHTAAEIAITLVFITGLVYACALRPRVVTDAAGVTVQNPLRDHRIPWGSVTGVDLRESVQVHCAPEPGDKRAKVIHSWALYAHRRSRLRQEFLAQGDRRRLPRSSLTAYGAPSAGAEKPSAAQIMATQLDEMATAARERGAAAGPRVVTWPWPPAVAIAAPAIALVLVITLFR